MYICYIKNGTIYCGFPKNAENQWVCPKLGIYPSFSVSSQGHQRSINQAWGWYTILDCATICLTKWEKKRSFAWTPIKQILNPNPMTLLSSIELGFPHCMETWDLPQVQRSHMFQSPGSHAKLRAKWNTPRLCNLESFFCKSMSNLFRSKKRFPVLCKSVTRFFRHCAQSMAGASGKKLVTGTRLIHLDGLHCHKFLWKYWCVTSGFLAVLKQNEPTLKRTTPDMMRSSLALPHHPAEMAERNDVNAEKKSWLISWWE